MSDPTSRSDLIKLAIRMSPWILLCVCLLGLSIYRFQEGRTFTKDLRHVRQLEKNSVALYFSGLDLKATLLEQAISSSQHNHITVQEAIAKIDGQLAVAETQLELGEDIPALPALRRTLNKLKEQTAIGSAIELATSESAPMAVQHNWVGLLNEWFSQTDALSASAQHKITQLDRHIVSLQNSNLIMFLTVIFSIGLMLVDVARMWLKAQDAQAKRETLLSELAHMDPLTSLLNRRGWDDKTPRVTQRCIQANTPMSVVMLDLDHFKRYNDEYGHAAGDLLLKQYAQALQQRSRPGDVVARMGGEEFAMALPGCDADMAYRQIERIRRDSLVNARFSAGIVLVQANMSIEEALACADSALYDAKNQGRNRSVIYTPELNILPHMV